MKHRVVLRADGGHAIGMGHVVRCLALADMLINNFEIAFVIQQTADSILKAIQPITKKILLLPHTNDYREDALCFSQQINRNDIVVLDGYNFKTDYQKTIKAVGCKLVCIDDLHKGHYVADAIINHAAGVDEASYSAEPYTKFYLGFNYALLRKPFLKTVSTQRKQGVIKKVFISMGAADSNNITQKFIEALLQINGIEEINVMLGSINPHLKSIDSLICQNKQASIIKHFNIGADELNQLLQKCDAAICPASSISLECCAVGIVLISGYTADNQIGILEGLKRHKGAFDLGNMNKLNIEDLKIRIENVLRQEVVFNEMFNNQKRMIDGKSPERLLKVFRQFFAEQLHFKFAEESDVDILFSWANNNTVRENSYNSQLIRYSQHVKWFNEKINSGTCDIYIFRNEQNIPVGYVRMEKDITKMEALVGIAVDADERGKGYSGEMLQTASLDFFKRYPGYNILAFIMKKNVASYRTFINAGYKMLREETYKNIPSLILYKSEVDQRY